MAYWLTGADYANLPVLPLACVDIGSNTTRLLVAEVEEGQVRELAAVREFTLIGTALDAEGLIPGGKIAEPAQAGAPQVDTARRLGARLISVVCTAVLRSAPNAAALAEAVEEQTG